MNTGYSCDNILSKWKKECFWFLMKMFMVGYVKNKIYADML